MQEFSRSGAKVSQFVPSRRIAGIILESVYMDVLAEMNAFHIEGRYPESLITPPTKEEALNYIARAEEVFQWLMNRL